MIEPCSDHLTDPAAVTRTVDLTVDAAAAWHLIGTADGLGSWLGRDVEVDPVAGGALRLRDDDGTHRLGLVTSVHPGRSISFRWARAEGDSSAGGEDVVDVSSVTIDVDELDEGRARITVTETLASTGGRVVARADAGAAWDDRLLGLELGALLLAVPAFSAACG